jgi:hypothetical protein
MRLFAIAAMFGGCARIATAQAQNQPPATGTNKAATTGADTCSDAKPKRTVGTRNTDELTEAAPERRHTAADFGRSASKERVESHVEATPAPRPAAPPAPSVPMVAPATAAELAGIKIGASEKDMLAATAPDPAGYRGFRRCPKFL